MNIMYSLLLLSSLLHIMTCTVYTVTPDDHYYPDITCHHCHNLQHYLLNITKYFTSNTQLLFLPGLHHLHTDLIIQNVHNISLIGSTANGTTLDTVIQLCNSSVAIVMTNITYLTMKNMVIKHCIMNLRTYRTPVAIKNCADVILSYLQICFRLYDDEFYLLVTNIFGKSRFSHISCNKVLFMYDEIQVRNVNNTLLIDHLQQVDNVNPTYTCIKFIMSQFSYKIAIQLTHITFQQQWHVYGELCNSTLSIMDCEFLSNKSILITIDNMCDRNNDNSSVEFINCKFMKSGKLNSFIRINFINVTLINCIFNRTSTSLQSSGQHYGDNRITVAIKNTKFVDSVILHGESLLEISHANLLLEGMVTFHNITNNDSIIVLEDDSTITTHGRIEFSNNSVCHLIRFDTNSNQYIKIKEPSNIHIHHNQVQNYFTMFPCTKILYPFCIFQYFSNRTLQAE